MRELTPPLKWHGGKHYLARDILKLMPPRQSKDHPDGWCHYVEPYAGGLSVLLANDPEGISEVVNDLHADLAHFWRVLRSPGAFYAFAERCRSTAFDESAWQRATEYLRVNGPARKEVLDDYRAWCFFVSCRQSLAGRGAGFAPLSRNRTRRGMNEQVSAWLNAVEGLPAIHARLKRVAIVGPKDALEVIRQQDGPKTLFYLDPPYLHETRATTGEYLHEMTRRQHARLLVTLSKIEGRLLLSGYDSDLYEWAADRYGWRCHAFDLPNHAAAGASKRRMTECVWTNF